MARTIFVLFSLIAAVSALPLRFGSSTIYAKNLAGPPSDFAQNQLPLPEEVSQLQKSAFIPLWVDSQTKVSLLNQPSNVIWTGPLYVDSEHGWEFSFLCPNASSVTLTLTAPNGDNVDLSGGINGFFAIGGTSVPETSWIFNDTDTGAYTLTVTSNTPEINRESSTDDNIPFAYVSLLTMSKLTMVGHLSSYNMQQGQQVGLVASIVEDKQGKAHLKSLTPSQLRAKALKEVVYSAYMSITTPSGVEEDVEMYDDGNHMDFEANDGVYGGVITAEATGAYQAQATLEGQHSDGTKFIRTTQHLINTVADDLNLAGSAIGVMTTDELMTISLTVNLANNDPLSNNYRGYAEVYGQDSQGELTAACWIGGMTQVTQDTDGNYVLSLVLDINWLKLAGVSVPLTLQNVIIQETDAFIPVSLYSTISVQMSPSDVQAIKSSLFSMVKVSAPTKQMKEGAIPAEISAKAPGDVDGALLLLHGYCSGSNPWQANSADFTTAYYFLRASVSDSHDAFAQYVLAFAEANNLNSYSLIGHSQGGIVSAHIKNFYFSGLDLIGSGKKIQSVGTPYEGCTAAGSASNLGSLFGVGCGTNFDLSLDGSRLWEPSITTDTRSEIYYYTTTYQQGTWFGDSCNAAMNMVLEWPNDGTAEIDYTNIRGANSMGNTQKQCHINGMNYMAQYNDHSRNQIMNSAAAR